MNQRKMVQDARRRQAVVLVNRNFYRYHVEKIKFVQDKTAIQLLRKDSVLERLKELQRRRIVEQRNQVTIMITTGSLTFIVLLAAIVTWFLFMTPVIENIGKIFRTLQNCSFGNLHFCFQYLIGCRMKYQMYYLIGCRRKHQMQYLIGNRMKYQMISSILEENECSTKLRKYAI